MQTTLLGLAIAVILALLAALIGPYFVDWNQFRPQFEAEASRIIGAPVHVRDNLDARLLPTPTLRLRTVAIGKEGDPARFRADRLDVEFSLGSLMRGEWRATDLTLEGLALDLTLDDQGRLAWPASRGDSNLGALAIDHLKLGGRIVLHDATGRRIAALDDIAFAGDVRALAGAARGDGEFRFDDVRYPFRLVTSRSADGAATRVHLAIDPGVRPIGLDLDGNLGFEAMVPHFDGTVALSRAITLRDGDRRAQGVATPWKLTAKVKADPAAAKLDQLEVVYGSEEVGLKLTGSADVALRPAPSLRVSLAARQLDADRLLARESTSTEPTRLLPALRTLVAALPPPPVPADVALDADAVTLGGRQLQNIALEAHSDAGDWVLDHFDGRLPGATEISLGGRLVSQRFAGALRVAATDPGLLSAWLRGASEAAPKSHKPLRMTGLLGVSPDRVALDDMDAEIDGAAVTGRLALSTPSPATAGQRRGLRLEAAVDGERLDLDGLVALGRSFAGPRDNWPDEADLALDLKHGSLGGQEFAPLVAHLTYDANAVTLAKLSLGAAGGVAADGSGAIDRAANSGQLAITATAPALPALARVAAPFLPESLAQRFAALPAADGAAKVRLALGLDRAERSGASASATAEIETPHLKATLRGSLTSPDSFLRDFDVAPLERGKLSLDGKVTADRAPLVLGLLGLDRVLAAGEGTTQAEGSLKGTWGAPLAARLSLSGPGLDADAQGTLAPAAMAAALGRGDPAETRPGDPQGGGAGSEAASTIAVAARKLDLAPLFDVAPGRLPLTAATSRLTLSGQELSLDDVDATVSGARVRGRVVFKRGKSPEFHGEFGTERLDLATAIAMATGALGRGLDEPLGRAPCAGMSGNIELQTPRGIGPGGLEIKALSGTLRCDGASLSLGAKGTIGGGEAAGELTAQSGGEGVGLDAHLQLSGVDGSSLSWRGLAPPAGKTALQLTLSGRGRTAGVISGALSGGGTWSIERAKIGGLDPAAFDAVVAASDAGKINGDGALRDMTSRALKGAPLPVAAAQIPFTVRDGGLRVAQTTLDGDGARLVVSGGYDFTADQFDLRAELASTRLGTGVDRPVIEIFAHGPPDRLNRTVDVALLSSWLAVRAIDRETRRLELLERGDRAAPPPAAAAPPAPAEAPGPKPKPPQPAQPAPSPPQASAAPGIAAPGIAPTGIAAPGIATPAVVPPLPPPIDVKPAPGSARARLRSPRAPLQLAPVPPASIPN